MTNTVIDLFVKRPARCGLALLLAGAGLPAQTASPASAAAVPQGITYIGGQLRIDTLDSTLADVLAKVAALTGARIDVPAGASGELMPIVELGPGPARQIVASLLSDSNFDYMIQASDADPDKIQSVLLIPRDNKAGPSVADARPLRSPYSRAGSAASVAAPDPAEGAAAAAGGSTPDDPPAQSDPSAIPPPADMAAPVQPPQPGQFNPANPAPPTTFTPQAINQQLQQMYQQRIQMIQQQKAIPGAR